MRKARLSHGNKLGKVDEYNGSERDCWKERKVPFCRNCNCGESLICDLRCRESLGP